MRHVISIVTVCYNAGELLQTTINSIKEQTYKDIEFIFIDGNSNDNTQSIINQNKEFISQLLIENDKGIYDAMNKGLKLATGDFVIFMGAGDRFYNKNVLERISHKIKNKDSIYYGNVIIESTNTLYWGKFNSYKLALGNICHQAIFYPRNVYKNIQYSLKYKIFADYVYNLSLFNSVPFIYLDEIIAFYDYNGISSHSKDIEFEKDVKSIIKTRLGISPLLYRIIYHTLKSIKHRIWK